jgi:hypothetical protein
MIGWTQECWKKFLEKRERNLSMWKSISLLFYYINLANQIKIIMS